MSARRLLFWIHLITGCFAGLVILFFAITGSLLAYERQIIAAADSSHHLAAPCTVSVAKAMAVASQPPSAVMVYSDPLRPAEVTVGREPSRVLLIDPCAGTLIGESAPRTRHFFTTVTGLHRWFGLAAAHRQTARAVKGGFTLALVFMVVSGFVLWWPRRWNRPGLRQSMLWQFRFRGRARWWNWHNVTGFWIALPLLTICLTGVVMAYPWATNLLYRITGSPIPPPQTERATPGPHRDRAHEHGDHSKQTPDWDSFFATAERQIPGWRTATLRLQDATGPSLSLALDQGDGGRPDLRSQVVLERATGRVLRVENFTGYNEGRRLRMWARFVHTGEAGGILGETIAALTALGASLLVFTGFMLAIRRFLSRKRTSGKSAQEAVEQPLMRV